MLNKYSFEFYGNTGLIKRYNTIMQEANFARMVEYFRDLPYTSNILDGKLLSVYALKGKSRVLKELLEDLYII